MALVHNATLSPSKQWRTDDGEHSVLGKRWVYDGCGDPVWAATLAAAILTGGTQVRVFIDRDGERVEVPPRMQVRGSGGDGERPEVTSVTDEGTVTLVRAGDIELALARVVGSPLDGEATLTGTIGDSEQTSVLASLRRS